MKVVFLENAKDSKEHETSQPEAQEIFRLAERLSEAELEKLKKIVERFKPETVKQ